MRRAPVNPPGNGIAWVPVAPPRLRLLPAGSLTFWRVAGPLPDSCSRTRPEPPAADCAWSLPGLWHRNDLSLSSRAGSPRSGQNAWVTFGEHRWVNLPERRRPRMARDSAPADTIMLQRARTSALVAAVLSRPNFLPLLRAWAKPGTHPFLAPGSNIIRWHLRRTEHPLRGGAPDNRGAGGGVCG